MMDVPQKTGLADQLLIGIDQNSVPPCPAILQRVVNESQKSEPDCASWLLLLVVMLVLLPVC